METTLAPAPVFTFESSSTGYTIFGNGKPLGGARSAGTPTHTSWGSRRSWQAVAADRKMHAETARLVCAELTAAAALAEYTKRRYGQTPEQRSVGGLGWSGLTDGFAAQFADARRPGIHYIRDRDRSADFSPAW